jgi:hypothetical protein
MELIANRFDFARRTLQAETSERKLRYLLERGREEFLALQPQFDAELEEQLKELERFALIIRNSNEPTVMPERPSEWLNEVMKRSVRGMDGVVRPLVTDGGGAAAFDPQGLARRERESRGGVARGAHLQLPEADSVDARDP